jgi:four helix bundle protein
LKMAKITHFRELRVWQQGMDLVESAYRISANFPKTEVYALTSQLRRAAVSVPSNIAEGHSRASTREYLNHVSIAQASLTELETQLEAAGRLGYADSSELMPLFGAASSLGKQLYALREALLRKI